jgi:hypothetical protein
MSVYFYTIDYFIFSNPLSKFLYYFYFFNKKDFPLCLLYHQTQFISVHSCDRK